ncbi:MAG: hypothetical protein IT381_22535 [Deltaproteobacteria bacterium]|nr:hypothetical protein [Deltaproteobacteria bacterium]
MREVARPLICVAVFVACGVTGPTPQEILDRTVFTYNQHLRWKRFDKASRFVGDEARAAFVKTFESSEEALSIEDLEVKEIDFETPNRVRVSVDARYFKLPSVTVQKQKWVQIWEKKGDDWWLADNALGPFFPDAASKPASAPVKKGG